jgi:ATP-dependent Clp protease ATP-binding subunit ClpA
VTGANVLVAIFSEQESQAAYLLRKHEVSRLDVVTSSLTVRKDEPSQSSDNSASLAMKSKQAGRIVWKTSPPTLISLLALAVSIR